MLCQECGKRPATLHFTKIVNGEKTEFHFVKPVPAKRELIPGTSNGFSIHSLLSGLLDLDPSGKGQSPGAKRPRRAVRRMRYDVFPVQQAWPVRSTRVINISRIDWIHCLSESMGNIPCGQSAEAYGWPDSDQTPNR